MGYQRYTLPDGREGGYGVEAHCEQDGCGAKIDRGLSFLCGELPGGDEYGCGGYFCGEHLYPVSRASQCAVCKRGNPLCSQCEQPAGGAEATYPEDLCEDCYDVLDQHDRYGNLESLLMVVLHPKMADQDWRPLVEQALRGVRESFELDCETKVPAVVDVELPEPATS